MLNFKLFLVLNLSDRWRLHKLAVVLNHLVDVNLVLLEPHPLVLKSTLLN